MKAASNRPTGFDYLRVILACSVMLFHSRPMELGVTPHIAGVSNIVAGQTSANITALIRAIAQPVEWFIVPSFFALSGFLVAGSLFRCKSILEFISLRGLRIIPALCVETLLYAFILGPIVTEFSLREYFTSLDLWKYTLNIFGDIHYILPGVFVHNPRPSTVNGQLWTIPAELLCYFSLVVSYLFGIARVRWGIPAILICTVIVATNLLWIPNFTPGRWHEGYVHVDELALLLSFLAGVSLYSYQDKVIVNIYLVVFCAISAYLLLVDGHFSYLSAIPIGYVTVVAGMTNYKKIFITAFGDYSYGIYLYGFPIQQTVALAFPNERTHWFLFGFILALCITTLVAAASWHLIEFQILKRRHYIIGRIKATMSVFPAIPRLLLVRSASPD